MQRKRALFKWAFLSPTHIRDQIHTLQEKNYNKTPYNFKASRVQCFETISASSFTETQLFSERFIQSSLSLHTPCKKVNVPNLLCVLCNLKLVSGELAYVLAPLKVGFLAASYTLSGRKQIKMGSPLSNISSSSAPEG